MAYFLHHTLTFTNRITEKIIIELYKKDNEPDEVTALKPTYATKQFQSGAGNGFDAINPSELRFGFWLPKGSPHSYQDFLVSFHDEWKVILYNDDIIDFVGFLVPAEGNSDFKNEPPYELELSATDGLGFLKTPVLSDVAGNEFRTTSHIIDYILGALAKTGLDLNVRSYANIYEETMQDRYSYIFSDTFNNAKLNYRTFHKDATTFVDCYTALQIVLGEEYRLFQFAGKWLIFRIGEMQTNVGPKIWYTEVTAAGVNVEALQEDYDPAVAAKNQIIHRINADAKISAAFAIKSAKHSWVYTPWDEMPKNNKFERIGTQIVGIGNPDQKAFPINDWVYGRVDPLSPSTFPPNMGATTDIAYRLSTYNIYGVETDREVVLENGTASGHRMLQSEGIPVKQGDRMTVNFDFKFIPGGSGTMNYVMLSIYPDAGGLPYRLENNNPIDGGGPFHYVNTGALRFLSKSYSGENWQDYSSFTIDMPPFPVTGTFYVHYLNYDSTNSKSYYKNFSLEYHPYVAGGYIQVKGDYWLFAQNPDYKDTVDVEVKLSDSEIKVLKGALYRNNGTDLTSKTWHRLGVSEGRHYKELVSIARFNSAYRRMWKITGTFGGTAYHPYSDQTIRMPLGFHKHFYFPNATDLQNKYFELVPPLVIDYLSGSFAGNFLECYDPTEPDGTTEGDTQSFKYNFT